MFVFGMNLPVVEILFVVLVLFMAALGVVIYLLVRMNTHIDTLDELVGKMRQTARAARPPKREEE